MSTPAITPVSPVPASAPRQARHTMPAELPDAPTPVTPANAAVHIMKVPSSRLVEAFVSLQRAIGLQTRSQVPPPEHAPARAQMPPLPTPAPRPAIDLEA
jgi:hypothetical protein